MTKRIAMSLLLALATGCAGSDDDPAGPGGGGKADDLNNNGNGIPALSYKGSAAEVTDAQCDGCDAVGFGRATIELNAPLAGHVYFRGTIRHPNPDELAVFLDHNSNGDLFNPIDDGNWRQIIDGEHADGDELVHGIRKLDTTDGCTTTAALAECYEVTVFADLGMRDVIGSQFVAGDTSIATWNLDVIDKGFNGASGTITEVQLIIEDPKYFM